MERLNKTLLDEFYSLAFRKKMYESIEELQIDLDEFMNYYNHRRTHQGYNLKENGYDTPTEAHLSKSFKKELTEKLISDRIKTTMANKRKGVREKTNLADDFIEQRSEKEEVLACHVVTTS